MQFDVGVKALRVMALASAFIMAVPAAAQTEADIDALIDGSSTPDAALTLAHRQAGQGDLMGAAATLERALLGNPNAAQVRLYYAGILCRLGDRQTAQVELAKVDGRAITDTGWAELQTACGDVPRPAAGRHSGGLSGNLAIGLAYDSDLAGSLLVQLDTPGALPREDGLSFVGSARLAGRTQGSVFLYGEGNALTRNSIAGASADYQTGDLALGLGTRFGHIELSAGGVVRHTRFSGDPFETDLGGEAHIALLLGDSRLTLHGEVVQQDYAGSSPVFSRNGQHYDGGLDFEHVGGRTAFWLGGAYERKDAVTAITGYSGGRAYASLRQAVGSRGAYATLAGAVRYVEYVNDGFVQDVNETRWFARAAFGLPVGLRGLNLEGAGLYSRRDYNQAAGFKNYESVGGELRLVWNFGN